MVVVQRSDGVIQGISAMGDVGRSRKSDRYGDRPSERGRSRDRGAPYRDRPRHERTRSRDRERGSRERSRDRSRERSRERFDRSRDRSRDRHRDGGVDGRRDDRRHPDAVNKDVLRRELERVEREGRPSLREENGAEKVLAVGNDTLQVHQNGQGVDEAKPVNDDEEEAELRRLEALVASAEGEEVDFSALDEEREAERLAEERRKRREEILRQKGTSNGESAPPVVESKKMTEAFEAAQESAANVEPEVTFDIFSSSPVEASFLVKQQALKTSILEEDNAFLESNWDDNEGYYKARVGEVIAGKYHTLGVVGKGVFSTVLKCFNLESESKSAVAVKLIRSNDVMKKAAEKELSILLEVAAKDPDNKKFCVRLVDHGEYRNHVVFVFDYHSMNLREAIKKFGKDVGINISAVKLYARQLFFALKHLLDLRIVHADIKPDNILVTEDLKQVKLCDFGSAFRESDTDNVPTPYLVSRFYRAPEIILGLQCKFQCTVNICLK